MASCDVQTLLDSAACFDCLSDGEKQTVKLQLLCEIANGAGDSGMTQLTGDVTAGPGSGSQPATIASRAVTVAKFQAIATTSILGRTTAGSGDVEILTAAQARSVIGAVNIAGDTMTGPLSFSGSGNSGLRLSNLTTTERDAIASPAAGMAIWNTTLTRLNLYNGSAWTNGYVRLDGDTMTGALVNSTNGALSTPAFKLTGAPITGGSSTTTKPLALIETAGTTSTGWSTSGTMLGVNAPSGFGGRICSFQVNGTELAYITSSGTLGSSSAIDVNSTSGSIRINSDVTLSRKAAANLQLGAADAAAPVAQTLSVQNVAAGTTDTAGVYMTLDLSCGTGTGNGGGFLIRGAVAGSTGSSQNALSTWLRLAGNGAGTSLSIGNTTTTYISPFAGKSLTSVLAGTGMSFVNLLTSTTDDYGFWFTGNSRTPTSGDVTLLNVSQTFSPTSGTATHSELRIAPTINQTGGANGTTRALYINPTLTSAADFRALEISDGNVVLPKTVTAAGTTGARTINKVTGSVNFAAAATSLVVTNSYVTANSIITATVATNDATLKSVQAVAGAGSFTLYANAAATAETRVNFHVTN